MANEHDVCALPEAFLEQQPEVFKKPVQAIHIAISGGIQNKTQRLAFNAMLKHALHVHARDPSKVTETYVLSRTELMRTIGWTSPNRKHLKEALLRMQSLTVQFDFLRQDGELFSSCVLLPYVAFDRDSVYYSYAPQVKPLLFDSKIYAWLDLRIQRSLRLDAATALYEWANRFRRNPSRLTNAMTWEDWRWVIHGEVGENSAFHQYKIFKREKLKPAIAEINARTDLKITLIEDRDGGRSVKYLKFHVEEKPLFRHEDESEHDTSQLERKLEAFDLSARQINSLLKSYAPEMIESNLNYTLARMNDATQAPVKNKFAYLKRALEANYAPPAPAPAEVAPKPTQGSLDTIRESFARKRADEAAAMFNEMLAPDQAALVAEYNAAQTVDGMRVPEQAERRLPRFMIPFFGWLAKRTWGEPNAQEIFAHALDTGLIKMGERDK